MTSPPIELLAPAGSLESFFAAVEAGADAVYCGLKEFSARAKAKNFTVSEMERLTTYAHRQGKKLYVPLNTLIKETELPKLVETLSALASMPVDALIIQDLGLWRLARQLFPELPLHASTQMVTHNAAGVKMLEQMGFSRAVLARELSIDEITAIRSQTSMEIEHFVHGALCYSISGQCLFSSYTSGNSGNRGRCGQPCRRRYTARGKTGFYFSTSDLNAIALVPRLAAAGVMSFKIEGRMKNAEYVSTVVSAYRKVLDAQPHARQQAIIEAETMLSEAFGRATTHGLLKGNAPAGIASPSTKGGIGRPLGVVEKVHGAAIVLTAADTIHVGDRLRIQPAASDRSGLAFTVQEMSIGQRPVKRAEAGSRVRIATPFKGVPLHADDQVYKVATGKTFTLSPEACARRLAAIPPPAAPVRIQASFRDGRLQLMAEACGCSLRETYDVEMEQAARSPLSQATLHGVFAKTSHDSLTLARLSAKNLPPVAIKPSRLNEIRRDLYAKLAAAVETRQAAVRHERLAQARAALLPPVPPLPAAAASLHVVISGPRDLELLSDPGVAQLIVPMTPELLTAVTRQKDPAAGWQNRIVWDVPAIIFEGEWQEFRSAVRHLRQSGFDAFRINNIGHFQLFKEDQSAELTAGPWLYALNSQAVLSLTELGSRRFTTSLEDDKDNIGELLARTLPIPAMVPVYGPIALVTSRIPLRGVRSGERLASDTGEDLLIDSASGLAVAYAGHDFSLTGRLQDVAKAGGTAFVIDLHHCGALSRQGRLALAAAKDDQPLAGTTLFNYQRGLM